MYDDISSFGVISPYISEATITVKSYLKTWKCSNCKWYVAYNYMLTTLKTCIHAHFTNTVCYFSLDFPWQTDWKEEFHRVATTISRSNNKEDFPVGYN